MTEKVLKEVWTYVGAGAAPPHAINFMGKQRFVRFQAVDVEDVDVLKKLAQGNPSFVKGAVKPEDQAKYFTADEKAALAEAKQLKEDKAKDDAFKKEMAGKATKVV